MREGSLARGQEMSDDTPDNATTAQALSGDYRLG